MSSQGRVDTAHHLAVGGDPWEDDVVSAFRRAFVHQGHLGGLVHTGQQLPIVATFNRELLHFMASIDSPVSALSDLRISGKDGKNQALDQVVVITSSCDRGKRNNEQEVFQRQHIEDIKVAGKKKKGQPNYTALKAKIRFPWTRNVVMFAKELSDDLYKFAKSPETPASLTTCPSKKLKWSDEPTE
ncbi:hypothetical protein U0070_026431, partial [Myodes glareolus]